MTPAVQLLLGAETVRREGDGGKGSVIATAVGIGHLFLCGIAEPSLPRTAMDFVWREAAALEILLWILLSAQTWTGTVAPLLSRTRLLPIAAADRYVFSFAAMARRYPFQAVVLSGLIFLGVHFRSAPGTALTACVLYLTSALAVQALLALVFLLILKTRAPMATTLIAAVFLGITWILGASVVGTEGLLAALPIAGWWIDGVAGMLRGSAAEALRYEALTAAAGIISFVAGRRWS
jgi:hypothetical protein